VAVVVVEVVVVVVPGRPWPLKSDAFWQYPHDKGAASFLFSGNLARPVVLTRQGSVRLYS
jgi:hypothetical protein